ncbi:Crp/Fnr family transcriptional regulator [Flavihumibacter fluvii]|uniref:Crp/Fnr family transcriptional regulator n=1 Tax=Flavihumibacter fluvii TaxID=2838157 RepID=UPI001BDE3FB7|nr:Crp/Fnr family transcriptional regulator [Flavihumibacter fluvii]ULQ53183.1 Crp/Fnr family transcriptional regulator [Flavihumibacter fluvii]
MDKDYATIFGRILNNYSPVSPSTMETVIDSGNLQVYKKNDIIFPEKKFNAFEYFQLEGITHRYNNDEDNQAITTGIYTGEEVITPHFARTINSQSIFSLQALTACSFIRIPIGAFDKFRFTNDEIRAFGQRVVEKEFIRNLNYEVLFRSFTAKDRLLFFRANYPAHENLIPHTVIASFLGITPVSFSRLRNELVKQK